MTSWIRFIRVDSIDGESAITAMANQPIVAFVFDVKGLIADMSLRGAKFNKQNKSKLNE